MSKTPKKQAASKAAPPKKSATSTAAADNEKLSSNKATVKTKNAASKTGDKDLATLVAKTKKKKKVKLHPVFEESYQPMIHDHPLTKAEEMGAPFVAPQVERPPKLEGGIPFKLVADYEPKGDQPEAIKELVQNIRDGERSQVLLGVTGSGKTYTMAQVIEKTQRPALIMAHNKTLAAQLYEEFKAFFPNNSVEYFVSYYDYYQPEAYVPRTDTFIEKDSSINEQIDRMRHAATRAVMERDDVIIVASVSCIYGIGSVETYIEMTLTLEVGQLIEHKDLLAELVTMQYKRNDIDFHRGTFRVRGDTIELWPAHLEDRAWRISLFGDEIDGLMVFDPLTGQKSHDRTFIKVYANSHHVTPHPTMKQAVKKIQMELDARLEELKKADKLVELQRLEQRVNFDMEMMMASGSCAGVENYSRYLSGRNPGEPPPTLFEFLPENCLLFMDESHVSVSQINAMFKGDFRRKTTLAQYGFRLPSCMDNRPLRFAEWDALRPQSVFVSATPADWELNQTEGVFVEQIIRPTGLIDPPVEIRPAGTQVDDVLDEIHKVIAKKQRILVTTLTKRMAEDLTEYMHDQNIGVRYMHSDVDTLERIEIIRDLRLGVFDVLIGINLLREGLDIPECALVAILDADKEGFLRSETSLVQTIGRAARNVEGRVILYADKMTGSMQRAIDETDRRREKQVAHNEEHGIIPQSTIRAVAAPITGSSEDYPPQHAHGFAESGQAAFDGPGQQSGNNMQTVIDDLEKRMKEAAGNLEFEEAARLRDELQKLRASELLYGKDMLRAQLLQDKEG